MATLTVNGTDVDTLGGITALDGWSAGLEYAYPSTAAPGQVGAWAEAEATMGPRRVTVGIRVTAASVSARGAAIDALMRIFQGNLVLVFGDDTAKELRGVVTAEAAVSEVPSQSFVEPDIIVTYTITCFDPAKYDTSDTQTTFTTATAIAVGTLKSGGIIRVTGAATDPLITYKNSGGTTIATMGFTITIAANDYLEIDLDDQTVRKTVSSVTTNALDTWTSGDFFLIDPADRSGANNPTLTGSAGTCRITYRKKWRS